ncbi:sigma-70 family RNA polymerase sigma factor [Paenibacillus donghaensis]|uniref:sigma-70 family RNA polymerase sigma factor n=1 Tax=Paenibacillus donghaensis TaxID=414771 RepID=UPI0018840169|nr:sigma-70 family RNA polymerase sigma factor [Paenibacillus donghaensis]MBE9914228.1 sigma-70 family RNA polymerase sigma factor [Paenibacillus donghaensis]
MIPVSAVLDDSGIKTKKRALREPFLFSSDFIVQRFFSYPENSYLLCSYLNSQSLEIWEKMENAFCNFYFEVRFTKYLSSTVKFAFIDYERRRRRREERNIVIFDMELHEENEKTYGERYTSRNHNDQDSMTSNPQELLDTLSNEVVFKAFSELTKNQKAILTFTFAMCYLDKEIAEKLSITPQAVSKARNSALANLKKRISSTNVNSLIRREVN